MKIYKSDRIIISEEIIWANTFWKRLKGLLGRKNLEEGKSMVIYPCNSIHTFFMKFNIDIVFLDEDFKVIYIEKNMAPFKVIKYVKNARYVIEMDSRSSRLDICVVGEKLTIE